MFQKRIYGYAVVGMLFVLILICIIFGSRFFADIEETVQMETENEPVADELQSENEPEFQTADTEKKTPMVFDNLITVGIINSSPEESRYRLAIDTELKNLFTEENGYSVSFSYKEKSSEQVTAAKQFIADGVDYLLLSADDTADWKSVLKNAQDVGVRVILFDRIIDVDKSLYDAAVISDPNREGKDAVDWLKGKNLNECNIIHLQDVMGTEAQKAFTDALDAQLMADSGWKLVARQTADGDEDKAQKIVQGVIDSGEPFNVIYAENDNMAKGAVAALDAAGISHGVNGNVIVISFGCSKWALEELLAQNWNYDGQCSSMQAFYIDEVIMTMESGDTLAKKVIVMDEKGFDATTITAEDIMIYGIS